MAYEYLEITEHISDEDVLRHAEELLKYKDQLTEAEYLEVLQMKNDALDDIQEELLESRRKKIYKLLNIPEPRLSVAELEKRLEKIEKLANYIKNNG